MDPGIYLLLDEPGPSRDATVRAYRLPVGATPAFSVPSLMVDGFRVIAPGPESEP